MGFKKIIAIIYVLFIVSNHLFCQSCGLIDKNTINKNRTYYLLDSVLFIENIADLTHWINSEDTLEVKKVLEFGELNYNFEKLFSEKGVEIKKISLRDFRSLPKDSILLNKREKKIQNRYETLNKLYFSLLIMQNPKSDKVVKKLTRSKFKRLENKMSSAYSLLFLMYPIYTYKDTKLILYSMETNNKTGIAFAYELCTFNALN
jgi:hypothetical protein